MGSSEKKEDQGFLKTLSSIQFGIIILIAIVVVSIAGTIIPQGRSAEFYNEHYGVIVNSLITIFRFDTTYRSPLFIGLLCLFGLTLFLCSIIKFPAILRKTFRPDVTPGTEKIADMPVRVSLEQKSLDAIHKAFAASGFPLRFVGDNRLYGEKGRLGYLGSTFVHLSLLIFLIGGLVSLITVQRGYIVLESGQSTSEVTLYDENTIPLGFELELDDFQVEFYEDYKNRPKSYTSFVTVKNPDETVFDADIRVNHPLMHNGFTIYQSSYGIPEWARSYSATDDTALVEVTLSGAPDGMPPVATFGMVMGEYYFIPGFGDSIKIGLAEFHRDFEQIQYVSGEPNPAVKINVVVHNKIRWSVYAFENFPGMNMPMSQDLEFLFVMKDIKEAISDTNEYYTVLGVVKDRGILPMWIAAFMIMVGLTFTFYIRPKRIWVYDDNGKILIGGITKGDPDPLRKLIHKTIKNI